MRTLSGVTLAAVALVAFASGPLVPGFDVTASADSRGLGDVGSGAVSVGAVSVPNDPATLDRGEYGSGAYYLDAPPATVAIESVTGRPMVGYELRIPELGYTGSTVAFLSASDAGTLTLTLDRKPFAPDRVSSGSYRGETRVFARANGEKRLLYEASIRIEVRG